MRALLLLLVAFSSMLTTSCGPTDHVVVLMMENRSFDEMLGWLNRLNPEIDGLTESMFNLVNTSDPNSQKIYVNDQAAYVDPCPDHSIPGTTLQVFGGAAYADPAPMSGFVESAVHTIGVNGPLDVMSAFNFQSVPVISTLAMEYAVFDKWHASIPGPTMCNRAYLCSATSHGAGENDALDILFGYPQKTIFQALNESNISWGVYFEEIPTALQFSYVRKHLDNFHGMSDFATHLKEGKLPKFSFLEPIYFDIPDLFPPASDQHPAHDVVEGEKLIKYVYENLRNSSYWENTLLLIVYDEHGGFFDHVPTPLHGIPNPDNINSTKPSFDFTRLGVRVPAIAISPWVKKGTVIHRPNGPFNNSEFEHSSLSATLKKLWNLPSFLTKRDEWAGTFEHVISDTMRPASDCPSSLPTPPLTLHARHPPTGAAPPTELQLELVQLAAKLVGEHPRYAVESLPTEREAGLYVRQQARRFFGRELRTTQKDGY